MGKKAGKQVQSHNERAKTTSTLSQPAALDMNSVLTRFSPSGRLFAQLSIAVDADTCRVYEVQSGQCVGRWASSSANERISSIEWAELPSSSTLSNEEKPNRGKKRRKGGNGESNNNEDKTVTLGGGDSSLVQDASATASTSAVEEASSPVVVSTMEVLALGLKNASIILLHPTQSTIIQTISHPSITSPPISLSFPSSPPSSSLTSQPFLLWSCTANGQLSAWSLPHLSGTKGKLVAQYDTQCSSCSTIAIRYTASSKPQANGASNEGGSATVGTTTVQVLLGQFSIKLFEMPLPSTKQSLSDSFERPRIHLRSESSGHASEVSQIAWQKQDAAPSTNKDSNTLPQVNFVSIAKGDRFVSLWSAPTIASAEGPASGTLLATLGLDEEPRRIALSSTNNNIICCISSDAARIISLDPATSAEHQAGTSIKQRRKSVRSLRILTTASSSNANTPCMDAFLPVNPAGTICVASGTVKPALDSISYRDQTGAYIASLQLATRQQGSLNGVNGHTGAEAPRATYNEARQSMVLSAEAARDPSLATGGAAEEVDPTAEPTIAERLKDLDMQDHQGEIALQDPSKRKPKRGTVKSNIANALSTTQSLVQALHSADVRLLESCLAEKNPKIIRATVRRVPGTLVLPLVEALVERLSRRRKGAGEGSGGVDASRGQVLIEWLRNVLIVHLGYLITIPSLVERLSALHATLESRMSFHSQLLALSGRLDLVVSQIDIRAHPIQDIVKQQQKSSVPAKNMKAGSMAVKKYVEGEEESDDESSSDNEDEEDDSDDDQDRIEAAEEGDDEDIEDLVMANGGLSGDDVEDDDEEEDESEEEESEEDEIPALRKSKKKSSATEKIKPKMNGFLDIEAEESENEGSDEDGLPIRSTRKSSGGVKLNGVINEDSLDEDEEDLDQYESDFINDDSEEEDESGEEDDDDDDEDDEE